MKDISGDFIRQVFSYASYKLRGRLFRNSSFDIIDPSGNIVLRSNPPAIISSEISIFSINGDELVACKNKCSFKDAYFSGVYTYEFQDILTSEIIGGLRGIRNKILEDVEWQLLDSQKNQTGHITEDSGPPDIRYFGKPMFDIMNGFIAGEKVFFFKVNINSFRFEMSADFSMDGKSMLDRKLGIALACLFASFKRTPKNDT
jgi:hypothetical protein